MISVTSSLVTFLLFLNILRRACRIVLPWADTLTTSQSVVSVPPTPAANQNQWGFMLPVHLRYLTASSAMPGTLHASNMRQKRPTHGLLMIFFQSIQQICHLPARLSSSLCKLPNISRAKSVERALAELKPRQRVAIVLPHYQGFSNPEIAQIMGSSAEAVESLLARGTGARCARPWDPLLPNSWSRHDQANRRRRFWTGHA